MIDIAAVTRLVYNLDSEITHMSVSGTNFASRTTFARMAQKFASESRTSVVGIGPRHQKVVNRLTHFSSTERFSWIQ